MYYIKHVTKVGSAERAPASDYTTYQMVQVGLAESLPRDMVQVGWAESPPRVVLLLNINTLPEFWVCYLSGLRAYPH